MSKKIKREKDFFEKSESIYRAAVMSAVFAKSDFLFDKQGFVNKVIGFWYNMPGNSCQPYPELEEKADDLHFIYTVYREFKDTHELYLDINQIKTHEPLMHLNKLDLNAAYISLGEIKNKVMNDLMEIRNINIKRRALCY